MYDLVREPLPGEVACGLGARAAPCDDSLRPLGFAGEGVDDSFRNVVLNPGERQLVADPVIASTAIGQRGRPRLGVPAIVDERRSDEPLDDLATHALPHATALEEPVDLRRGAITM